MLPHAASGLGCSSYLAQILYDRLVSLPCLAVPGILSPFRSPCGLHLHIPIIVIPTTVFVVCLKITISDANVQYPNLVWEHTMSDVCLGFPFFSHLKIHFKCIFYNRCCGRTLLASCLLATLCTSPAPSYPILEITRYLTTWVHQHYRPT
jgi:hypothetical protein